MYYGIIIFTNWGNNKPVIFALLEYCLSDIYRVCKAPTVHIVARTIVSAWQHDPYKFEVRSGLFSNLKYILCESKLWEYFRITHNLYKLMKNQVAIRDANVSYGWFKGYLIHIEISNRNKKHSTIYKVDLKFWQ